MMAELRVERRTGAVMGKVRKMTLGLQEAEVEQRK
jgi:hypothetical protein